MSAFMCSARHFHVVAQFIEREVSLLWGRTGAVVAGMAEANGGDRVRAIATLLAHENAFSMATRYPLTESRPTGQQFPIPDPDPGRSPREYPESRDPVKVAKAIQCLEYQSCEHDGWQDSEARELLRWALDKAVQLFPGYQQAAWGIE
jgi:hypothetical protein